MRFAADERADTTLAVLAECFEMASGVPKVVLADRMGCLRGGVVTNVVVPSPGYVRFATHYRFRPDFCEGGDPASNGIVENLVGYAKADLMVPADVDVKQLEAANIAATAWCVEVNGQRHSETYARPVERLVVEADLLAPLPSLQPCHRADHSGQGRPAFVCADRLGPLLGPGPPHRCRDGGAGL